MHFVYYYVIRMHSMVYLCINYIPSLQLIYRFLNLVKKNILIKKMEFNFKRCKKVLIVLIKFLCVKNILNCFQFWALSNVTTCPIEAVPLFKCLVILILYYMSTLLFF